ncbi:hypothetical protein RMCBS344292_10480 [Rhizopus microsporus]|nr:hypothetical protein RMCBS344292_10480 [Rhizopus microsporus]
MLIYLLYLFYFAVAVTVALSLLLYTYQCELLYASGFPSGSRTIVAKPSQYGLPDKEVILMTEDGYRIRAYVMIQRGEEVALQSPTVVCFHVSLSFIMSQFTKL